MSVPWVDPPPRELGSPSSPDQVIAARETRTSEALTKAIYAVEDQMTQRLVHGNQTRHFRVGFAPAPLGGGEAWIDENVVPFVLEIYRDRGWDVRIDGHELLFSLPEDS